ncbi:hypothetical protein HTVC203P_gp08 [Pelagibacter phage HTVC203P]|nr:hypothetical protein HTVC203P_gp08 [Pelagibacter phage HTVC203P]
MKKTKGKNNMLRKYTKNEQEIIKQKLLTPIYNGCNDDFYLLWKNKHDQYSEECFWTRYNNNKILMR